MSDGPPRTGEGSPVRRTPGPLTGLLVGALLGVTVFLAAAVLHDRVFGRRSPAPMPEGFIPGGGARGTIRILATLPGGGLQAALLPLREDGAPSDAEASILDGALFPGEGGRSWARLLVANPRDAAAPFLLRLAGGALRLEGASPAASEDLAAAFMARRASLSRHRILDLLLAHVPEDSLQVAPGSFVRALIAFPAGTDLAAATGLEIPGGPRLGPREVATESLRAVLADGRIGSLPEAVPAEARGAPEPGR